MGTYMIGFMEASGCGNAISSVPLLKAIKRHFSSCHLTVFCWQRSYKIFEGLSFIDEIVIEHPAHYFQRTRRVFDYIFISPVGALTFPELAMFAKEIISNPVKIPWREHEGEIKIQMIRRLGYKGETPKSEICISKENEQSALHFLSTGSKLRGHPYGLINQWGEVEPYICIGATYLHSDHWALKHFGDDKYIELINKIKFELDFENIILVGSKEDTQCERIAKETGVLNACGFSDDIKDTAALIEMSQLVIGNDGCCQHLAATLEVPTVTIWTFTNPTKNSPLGDKNTNVMVDCPRNRLMCQHGGWRDCQCLDVPIDDVFEAVKEKFA